LPDFGGLPAELIRRLEEACTRFEVAWQAGTPPQVEDYLAGWEGRGRAALLRELLALDAHYRRQAGQQPRADDYRGRFPDLDTACLAEAVAGPDGSGAGELSCPALAEDTPTLDAGPRRAGLADAERSPGRSSSGSGGQLPLPRPFGGYVLLEKLGRGAMGVVYRARQQGTNRLVALKMLLAGSHADAQELRRFQVEAEAAARLKHPNVVTVYEFGQHEGVPYFSMELIEGPTLAVHWKGKRQQAHQAAELLRSLAGAVQHAHDHQIVHRDLKPGNILLGADRVPKITDFGLAKLLDRAGHTQADEVLGTASYMAPEQAAGNSKHTASAADIYSLGAILYEALTGRPPFRATSRQQVLEQVRTQQPPQPRTLRPTLDAGLERIVLRCLQKDPDFRYRSAAELAEALDGWLRGRRARFRPWYGLLCVWYALRLHPLWSATALLLLAAVVGTAVAWWHLDPDREVRQIEQQLARGQMVTLIGPTGKPRWSRWVAGGVTASIGVGGDGTVTVSTWDRSLLELVRDPQTSHYLLRAEVRHQESDAARGEVGLFFGYRRQVSAGVPVHLWGRLTYNDIDDMRRRWAQFPPMNPKPPPPAGNRVFLGARLYIDPADGPYLYSTIDGLAPETFRAVGHWKPPRWRKLAVEVSPQRLVGWWEDEPRPLGAVLIPALEKNGEDVLASHRKEPRHGDLRAVHAALDLRGPIGLAVCYGSAAFRNVVIEPLDDGVRP
jgi:serine/threonine-protein kinase